MQLHHEKKWEKNIFSGLPHEKIFYHPIRLKQTVIIIVIVIIIIIVVIIIIIIIIIIVIIIIITIIIIIIIVIGLKKNNSREWIRLMVDNLYTTYKYFFQIEIASYCMFTWYKIYNIPFIFLLLFRQRTRQNMRNSENACHIAFGNVR